MCFSNGSNAASTLDSNVGQGNNSTPLSAAHEENLMTVETCISATPSISETEQPQERAIGGPANVSSSMARIDIEDIIANDAIQMIHGTAYNGRYLFCI